MHLTPKQEAFALAYVETGNASEAYRRAYDAENMKPAVIAVKASELLKNGKVAVKVAEVRQAAAERTNVTVDRVIREYARIAFADMRKYASVGPGGVRLVDSEDWTDDDAAAVAEVAESTSKDGGSIRFKLHSKVSALDSIAKHLGMFVERSEVDVTMRVEALAAVATMTPEQLQQIAEAFRGSRS